MDTWRIKSESDTDRVWAKVNKWGNEVGEYRYEFHQVPAVRHVHSDKPIKRKAQVRGMLIGALAGAGAVLVAHAVGLAHV